MAATHNPKILTDNLQICLDPKNTNSFASTSSTTGKSTGQKLKSSGQGWEATISNGGNIVGSNWRNRYIDLDGVNDKLSLGAGSEIFTSNKAFTLEGWFYPTADDCSLFTLGKARGAASTRAIDIFCNGDNLIYVMTNDSTTYTVSQTVDIPTVNGSYTSRWHHIVLTCEATAASNGVKLYCQAVLHDQATQSSYSHDYSNSTKTLDIGSSSSSSGLQGRVGLFRYLSLIHISEPTRPY